VRGFHDAHIFPIGRPDLAKARKLAAGKGGTAVLYTYTGDPAANAQIEVLRTDLARIGIRLDVRQLAFGVLVSAIGDPREPYDMVLLGWQADYPDPFDFINILLDGRHITPQANQDLAQMNVRVFNRRMQAASRLTGDGRAAAYAKLDVDIMRDFTPWIPIANANIREFVSSRVGCFVPHPLFTQMDLAAACLK
jgi:peptide/nickel transport system substrate-binding protein